nr:HTTM domain-containing protein [uncultured Psychroserpens sp.]
MSNLKTFLIRPFQFEGTKMHANVLLMCKLLVILLVTHHIFFKIADPFIPFIPALDYFHNYPNLFNYALKAILLLGVFCLFFNIKVRTASIAIGLVIIVNTLGSKPLFFNHTFICACALILAGLSNNKQPPYLLILQLSLVYFGASINKFLDADWWSGAFMDTWLGSGRENPVYLYVSELLPNMVLAKILSYIGMFTEFAIAVMILFKRTRSTTLWFIIIFHTTLFTLTSFRFGHFLESLVLILLAFLNFPKNKLMVHFKAKSLTLLKRFFKILDQDHKQNWIPLSVETKHWLTLKLEDKTVYNHTALRGLLLNTPNFFMLLMVLDIAIYIVLYNYRTTLFIVNAVFVWTMIFYFLPFNKKSQ